MPQFYSIILNLDSWLGMIKEHKSQLLEIAQIKEYFLIFDL